MSKEFVAVVTEGMDSAVGRAQKGWLAQLGEHCDGGPEPEDLTPMMIKAALAHPDFQRQVRAYAAAVARGLVAAECSPLEFPTSLVVEGHNACRAETLAAIDRWERENERA